MPAPCLVLVKRGNPRVAEVGALWNPATSEHGWFASPDNCAADALGNLWVATDQGPEWSKSGTADGLWHLETAGEGRGTGRMFFRVPVGAELCGPIFTPDDRSLFLVVQHPAIEGAKDYAPFGRDSTFADPTTRWPDFDDAMPPRPAVLAITNDDGGPIGA
ncbi:MAG: alkaline phosphatase PhoX [Kiloniellales bacterium]